MISLHLLGQLWGFLSVEHARTPFSRWVVIISRFLNLLVHFILKKVLFKRFKTWWEFYPTCFFFISEPCLQTWRWGFSCHCCFTLSWRLWWSQMIFFWTKCFLIKKYGLILSSCYLDCLLYPLAGQQKIAFHFETLHFNVMFKTKKKKTCMPEVLLCYDYRTISNTDTGTRKRTQGERAWQVSGFIQQIS